MDEKTKKIMIVEIIALGISLVPMLVIHFGAKLEAEMTEELADFLVGLNLWIVFPLLAVFVSSILALCNFNWRYALWPVPIGFMLGGFLFLRLGLMDLLFYTVIYGLAGLLISYVIGWLKSRREEHKTLYGDR